MVAEGSKKEGKPSEVRIAFIGIEQKSIFFEKLCEVATKVERHINYQDTFYLTFDVDGDKVTVELTDPGVEHTGAREMSIRKAQGAILFYSTCSAPSFHMLSGVLNDFNNAKTDQKLPIMLIGSEDDYLDEDFETSSTGQSSASEGYESETPHIPTNTWKKRGSMDKMRICDENRITAEQGKQMAQLFGPECKFVCTTISNFTGTKELIDEMIKSIRQTHRHKANFLARTRAATFPKSKKNGAAKDGEKKKASSLKILSTSKSPKTPRRKKSNDPSTACTIS